MSTEEYRKYSTFLELNCQSILLGRYNTPLTPPFFPCQIKIHPLNTVSMTEKSAPQFVS
jgi:hypothetical protein